MPETNARNIAAPMIWRRAQVAAPAEMAGLLKELRNRGWAPANPLEKEWFDELSNLCSPLDLNAFSNELGEVVPIISPGHSAGDYSLKLLSGDELLTHSPASAGLLQGWSIPHCRETFRHRLYSRRAVCQVSPDGKLLAGKTETDHIALYSLPEARLLRQWKHPVADMTYRIVKFVSTGELLVTDSANVIHFLSTADDSVRSYPKLLFRQMPLLAASDDGQFLITPEHGKRLATIWRFPQVEKLQSFPADELSELSAAFSPDGLIVVLTSSIELQVRVYPFSKVALELAGGREFGPPLVAFSHDNSVLAILRRSNPPGLDFVCLKTYRLLRQITLAEHFAAHQVMSLIFSPDDRELLLTGKETVYALNVAGKKPALSSQQIRKLANLRIRDFQGEHLQALEYAFHNTWMSMYLRAWVDMLIYLVKRRTCDIEIAEIGEPVADYDIEIEDV